MVIHWQWAQCLVVPATLGLYIYGVVLVQHGHKKVVQLPQELKIHTPVGVDFIKPLDNQYHYAVLEIPSLLAGPRMVSASPLPSVTVGLYMYELEHVHGLLLLV
jgi:hypothetical protein